MNITPGPYHLSGNAVVSDDEVVAQFPTSEHRDANMQAVAALPKLIAALTRIRDEKRETIDGARSIAGAALRGAGL
jgi:hypothetical protein